MLFQFCLFVLTTPCFSVWCMKEGLRIVPTCCSPVKENFCLIPECLSKEDKFTKLNLLLLFTVNSYRFVELTPPLTRENRVSCGKTTLDCVARVSQTQAKRTLTVMQTQNSESSIWMTRPKQAG